MLMAQAMLCGSVDEYKPPASLETQRSQRKYYFSFEVDPSTICRSYRAGKTAKEKLSASIDKQTTYEGILLTVAS
jgi:hypothetical protein